MENHPTLDQLITLADDVRDDLDNLASGLPWPADTLDTVQTALYRCHQHLETLSDLTHLPIDEAAKASNRWQPLYHQWRILFD